MSVSKKWEREKERESESESDSESKSFERTAAKMRGQTFKTEECKPRLFEYRSRMGNKFDENGRLGERERWLFL